MAFAQAALYPHAGTAASRLWDGWQRRAHPRRWAAPTPLLPGQRASDMLRHWFAAMGGKLGN